MRVFDGTRDYGGDSSEPLQILLYFFKLSNLLDADVLGDLGQDA